MPEDLGSDPRPARRPRRTFTKQSKAELVGKVDAGERSLALIALDHDINANLLHKWVSSARASTDHNRMVPVAVENEPRPCDLNASFELDHGCGTFRFSARWDPSSVTLLTKSLG